MPGNVLKLSAFLALAQHEVQQTLEYLARPEVRQVGQASPSQVLATVGNVKLTVPLQFAIGRSARAQPKPTGDPAEVLLPGAPWPPGSQLMYQINATTVPVCAEIGLPGLASGTLLVEFITVLKQ
jgi:hypothetical protein